jgi:uncharacterized repeat protein (TIGR01451 family)
LQAIDHLPVDLGVRDFFYSGARYFIAVIFLLAVSGRVSGQAAVEAGASSVAVGPSDTVGKDQPAQASPTRGPIHIVPFGAPKTPSQPKPVSSNQGKVQYWGGPVIANVNVVEVLWGNFVDAPSTTGLDQFFTDITSSNYFGMLAEYGTVGLNGNGSGSPPGSNQIIGPGMFGGKFMIVPSLCPGSAANPSCSIDDTQIQPELLNQINAGHLPQPVQDNQGNYNTLYMIYFPPGVSIFEQGFGSCGATFFSFCAYHSNVNISLKPKLPYGVFPDFGPTSGCSAANGACGSGTSQQNLTSASSHELGEAVSDVEAGTATTFAPPLAWADQTSGQEIGDFCNQDQRLVTVNSHTYTVQALMSNMQNGSCVQAPAHYQLTAQANANPGKAFNVTVAAQTSVDNSVLTGYNNTAHFTSSDASAVLAADYTFVPGTDSGTHTFSVTLNATGSQTVKVNDTEVLAMTGQAGITVSTFPDLTVTSVHAGSFNQGQSGATYTLTVTNTGNSPTSNPVSVTDSLPASLAASAISGSGWSCTLGTLTCTRSDALAANASYPAIVVTVNVSPTAPTPVVNTVKVSTSGDLNPTNDTAMDSTVVVQLADLVISKTHSGSFSQGQIGETYTLTVQNIGNGPTVGAVAVTDTLPTGLTATAISGTGWTCPTLAPLTCTRGDVLGSGGASYPPITLTVNVAANAPMPTVTNVVAVSGGGELITNNDAASDITTITLPVPDLAVSSAHNGSFTEGQAGVYTLTVSNVGPQATNGTVTVADNLPGSLFAASASGAGWNCALPQPPATSPVNCTRSDVLAPSASYPPITLTIVVGQFSPASVINVATVSGGGDPDAGESTSDPTTIIQLPNLDIFPITGDKLVQGATGASWLLEPRNIGDGATSGLITVTVSFNSGVTPTGISGNGWNCTLSPLSCTRSDPQPPLSFPPFINVTVNYSTNITQVTQTLTITGGGEANTNNTFVFTNTLQPSVVVSFPTAPSTVTAGGTANFALVVTDNLSNPGSQVTLACGTPLPPGTACSFAPGSTIQFQTPVVLSVTTTAPAPVKAMLSPGDQVAPLFAVLLPILLLIAAARESKGRRFALVTGSMLVLLFLAGCGGHTTPPPPVVPTPPGTYTITAVATNTATNQQATAPVTLIVK